ADAAETNLRLAGCALAGAIASVDSIAHIIRLPMHAHLRIRAWQRRPRRGLGDAIDHINAIAADELVLAARSPKRVISRPAALDHRPRNSPARPGDRIIPGPAIDAHSFDRL